MKPRLTTLLVALWLALLSVNGIAAQTPAAQNTIGTQAALGTNFVYQGLLNNNGQPANGAFDFEFKLYDTLSGGSQVGTTSTAANQTVTNGLFTVMIDVGPGAFNGSTRFLQISVRPANTGGFVALSPRVELAAAPHAQFSSSTGGLQGRPVSGAAPAPNQVLQWDGSQWVPASTAVAAPLNLSGSVAFPNGVISGTNSGSGRGIRGVGDEGVAGESPGNNGIGVHGIANNGADASGVWGGTTSGFGVVGQRTTTTNSGAGVLGLQGSPANFYIAGVAGSSSIANGNGVTGYSDGANATGVYGRADNGADAYGVWGQSANGFAGYFTGKVNVTGAFTAANKQFKIDHPLDPTNKYLYHTSVESPDMKNIYDGVVALDANGAAVVELPAYFQALNQDFRYQLTCIGGFAPIYIDQEIQANRFRIAGGKPGMKVSWQVTGIRHDAYAEQHRAPVEEDKPAAQRGTYLQPAAYGQPATLGVDFARNRPANLKQATPQKGR
jgi:hypothetical protein